MIKDSIIYTSEKFLRLISNFLLSVWIIRNIGPTEFGYYSLALTIVILLFSLCDLGIESIITKDMKLLIKKRGRIIFTAVTLKLILSIFLTLLIAFFIKIINKDYEINNLIIILSIGQCITSFGYLETYFFAIQKSLESSKIYFFTNLISIFFKIITIKSYPNSFGIALCYLYEHSLFAIFSSAYLYKSLLIKKSIFKFSIKYAKVLISKAKFLLLANIFSRLSSKAEILVLGILYDSNVVGLYAAAKKVIESSYFIPTSIINIYYPQIIKSFNSVNKSYLRKFSIYMIIVMFFISLLIFRFRYFIVNYFLGEAFSISGELLAFLSWSLLFVSLALIRKKYFIAVNKQKLVFFYAFINLSLMITLIFVLNFFLGINGIALTQIVLLFISLFVVPSMLKIKPWYYFH